MAKGENIFRRKDGRWEARYIKGRQPSGKIQYGFCYGKTYKEAKEKVTRYKAALSCALPLPERAPRKQFGFYCDAWLSRQRAKVRESTYMKYVASIRKHIRPRFGGDYLPDITRERIEAFSDTLLAEGLAPKTVHDLLILLRSVLKYAAELLQIVLPTAEIHYPPCSRQEMRVLTGDEQRRFAAYLLKDMDCCRFGVLLALYTGLRIGELCALRWDKISPEDGTIRICAAMQRLHNAEQGGTKIVIGAPKSERSARTIPLPDALAALCSSMQPPCKTAYVLTGTNDYMEPRKLQYRMAKFTRACNLQGVHFHTLRHTFATRAVEAGFDPKSLSELLGHASTTITMERYVHASMELKRRNMNRLTLPEG